MQTSGTCLVVSMLNGLSTSRASHIRTVKLCDITVWQAAGTAGKGRTTRASPTKDEDDDEVSQLPSIFRSSRTEGPGDCPSSGPQNLSSAGAVAEVLTQEELDLP